ncbi:aromatic prenyltransferase [Yinghuangia sp. YIM S09857]|uniref:aromatic prenyltransferase n=1 Tax=Yinghuangia sp. YIM S09857 TaxID=3436929 RepID=UPI003F53BB33
MSAVEFSSSRFLRDLEYTAGLLGAPYSQPMAHRVLHAFEESFHRGAVLWRTTDKPGGALNYRFYERVPVDTMRIAERAGFLALPSPAARLISAWSALYDGSRELCDFDSATGLVKTWVYLEGKRPLAEVLSPPEVPDAIRRREADFHELGLDLVRNVAVDYQHGTANLYFHTHEGISPKAAEGLLTLSESAVPDEATYQDMAAFMPPDGFTFSVTLRIDTGNIERVGFYALRLPAGQFPRIGDRLAAFFDQAPSHDEEEMNAVAWSFGSGTGHYLRAERSYCGRLVALMRDCASPMTAPQNM